MQGEPTCMLVRMRSMPPTDSMDMAGKSSTAISGDTGVSGNRGYQRGPPGTGDPLVTGSHLGWRRR